jgi:transposase
MVIDYGSMRKTISLDLRQRILACCEEGKLTRQQIADRYRVSLGMVKKLLAQRKKTGDIAPRHRYSGRKPLFTVTHRRQLGRLIEDQPDITLEEMREALALRCTLPAIYYVLRGMKLTYKKNPARQRARARRRQAAA